MFELGHYVEIREEFEQVKALLQAIKPDDNTDNDSDEHKRGSGGVSTYDQGVRKRIQHWLDRVRNPGLRRKYNELLVQIRFHELRVHFLEAYNLPLKLKVSDYLLRCEHKVLIKLVHVSSIAWLLLTGAINVLYYVLGISTYKLEYPVIADALVVVFFVSMALFILIACLVYQKMTLIFRRIMVEHGLWDVRNVESEERDRLAEQQLELFWMGDPKLVIASIQFMNFGYAVMLSVVIIYWEEIEDSSIPAFVFLLILLVCYSLFLYVTAHVIPRYTLCTSLAQLVDEERLRETVAAFKLSEARRAQVELEWNEVDYTQFLAHPSTYASTHSGGGTAALTQGNLAAQSAGLLRPTSNHDTPSAGLKRASKMMDTPTLMAELVKLDTGALRGQLDADDLSHLDSRKSERSRWRRYNKSKSEGVVAMAAMGLSTESKSALRSGRSQDDLFVARKTSTSSLSSKDKKSQDIQSKGSREDDIKARRRNRKRMRAVSDGVATMASMRIENEKSLLRVPLSVQEEDTIDHMSIVSHGSSMSENRLSVVANDALRKNAQEDEDGFSIHSTSSEGGYSDVDDVPQAATSIRSKSSGPIEKGLSLEQRLHKYFLSRKFVVLSNVLGTMVAFYLIGQRIEKFLHTEGIVSEAYVSFEFGNTQTFWALFVYMCIFIVIDVVAITVLWPFGEVARSYHELTRLAAACIDCVLVSSCFILYITAESQRCCNDERRELGEGKIPGHYYLGPAECACPAFGSRLYSGLGRIEPFVSFLGLRLFRFFVAKRLVSWFDDDSAMFDRDGISAQPFAVYDETSRRASVVSKKKGEKKHGYDHSHGEELKGTAAELWEAAVGEHPELAAKHGEFSVEILKVMLGIHVPDSDSLCDDVDAVAASHKAKENEESQSFTLGYEYCHLSADAQRLILSGKLGKPVKHSTSIRVSQFAGAIPENEIEDYQQTPDGYLFEIDAGAPDHSVVGMEGFHMPHARLVRSMRRCDRKLLPMLDKWSVVDVVMTRFDIVYFDAGGVDALDTSDSVREALIATNGGKGMRLCDIATGRRIVGRLSLEEIECATVEREVHVDGEKPEEDGPDVDATWIEWWMKPHEESSKPPNRAVRWNSIQEDRLCLHTANEGTLYLRFYSDLEDAENHPEHFQTGPDNDGAIFKNNSFQWVQTIGRFLGPEHLKQSMPNFNTPNELKDYLVLHYHHLDDGKNTLVSRVTSTGDLRRSLPALRRRRGLSRLSSFGDSLSNVTKSPRKAEALSLRSADVDELVQPSLNSQRNQFSSERDTQPTRSTRVPTIRFQDP